MNTINYPVIELEESEMFRNTAGEVCMVEVRGERSYDKCYFKVKDIGRVFSIKRLENDILKSGKFNDYIINIFEDNILNESKDANRYFNYFGLTKWIMSSRDNELAMKYSDWMMKTLFTVQFGKKEDKEELVKTLEGTDIKNYKLAMSKCVNDIKCVYIFTIGTVKDLRKSMNIPSSFNDSKMVVKYGLTKNLEKRFQQHKRDYSAYKGSDVKLQYYALIDASQLYKVEDKVRKGLDMFKLRVPGRKELVCMSESRIQKTRDFYKDIVSVENDKIETLKQYYEERIINKVHKQVVKYDSILDEVEEKMRALEEENTSLKMILLHTIKQQMVSHRE
jgi:hypothetical protein